MKLLIAGSRSVPETEAGYRLVATAVREAGYISPLDADAETYRQVTYWDKAHVVTEVVSGGARGVDVLAIDWAVTNWVPWKEFPADWQKYGKKAGILRNVEMGDYADALVAVWDGDSRGTKHMIDYMRSLGKPVYVKLLSSEDGR